MACQLTICIHSIQPHTLLRIYEKIRSGTCSTDMMFMMTLVLHRVLRKTSMGTIRVCAYVVAEIS